MMTKRKKVTTSLPQQAYTAHQVQLNEAKIATDCGISMYQLMERAGSAVFEVMNLNIEKRRLKRSARVTVICGKGNNGGDGFVVARLALAAGMSVSLLLLTMPEQLQGDALTAYQHWVQAGGEVKAIANAAHIEHLLAGFQPDVIIDGILGTGFHGQLSTFYHQAISAINRYAAEVIAIDIPSGLHADTGVIDSIAINAVATVTFIGVKQGLLTGQAANVIGELAFAGLGIASAFAQQVDSQVTINSSTTISAIASRQGAAHKGQIGRLLMVGGDKGMPGAIRLAAEAALRSGAPLVSVCCHKTNQTMVFAGRSELMLAPTNAAKLMAADSLAAQGALVIGPGLGTTSWGKSLLTLVLNHLKKVTKLKVIVLDADALTLLAENPSLLPSEAAQQHESLATVLTPHPGEAARLLACTIAEIERNRFAAALAIAKKYRAITVLKGAGTVISDGEHCWLNTSGNAGMVTGGMGDVLSGMIAALSMQSPSVIAAVNTAVFIHGQAADMISASQGQIGLLASDLLPVIPLLINQKS